METRVDEIAPDVYRLCTYVPDADFQFNQYLVLGEEPLLFHTGPRALFPLVAEGMARVMPVDRLRWVTFGHVEADECGAMNAWLAAAPRAEVAHGALGCMVSVEDMADRPPRRLADGEVIDVGGRRLRHIDTPHVPHGWDAGVLFEETTGTLLCGDLFTGLGDSPALTEQDVVGPAVQAEDVFGATCLTPGTAPALRGLAELRPTTLALMHGPAFAGDCGAALRDLADAYEARLTSAGARFSAPGVPVPPSSPAG
ncbi:oxygen-binding di-iron domain-containing protein [Blastococcus sp. SYSU D00813]